jgi:hypothetical protein
VGGREDRDEESYEDIVNIIDVNYLIYEMVGGREDRDGEADDETVNTIDLHCIQYIDEMVAGREVRDEEADDDIVNDIDFKYLIYEMVDGRKEGHMNGYEEANADIINIMTMTTLSMRWWVAGRIEIKKLMMILLMILTLNTLLMRWWVAGRRGTWIEIKLALESRFSMGTYSAFFTVYKANTCCFFQDHFKGTMSHDHG